MFKKGYIPWNKEKKLSVEHIKKIIKSRKGYKHTEETKTKIRLSNIGKHNINGKNNPFYGKHHTEKSKKLIRLHRPDIHGKNNPNFGNHNLKGHKLSKIQCHKISLSKRGENNPAFINGEGKFPYPMEFNKILKEQIRKRDYYTCQKCKIKEKKLIGFQKKLSIHHIDYNKTNCSENNLITLCDKCNKKVNTNRDYWFAYFTYMMNQNKDILVKRR